MRKIAKVVLYLSIFILFKVNYNVKALENQYTLPHVTLENYRQFKFEFEEKVKVSSITGDNVYVNMMDNITWDLSSSSLKSFCGDQQFNIYSESGEVGSTVYVETTKNKLTDIGFNENVLYTISFRNVKNLYDEYLYTTSSQLLFKDTEGPYLKNINVVYDSDNLSSDRKLRLLFNEPVNSYEYEGYKSKGFMIYIDGIPVKYKDTEGLNSSLSVKEQSTLDINLESNLFRNDTIHIVEVVGSQDLSGNLQKEGILKYEFKIDEPQVNYQPMEVPKVNSINQIEDNVLKVSFSGKNVVPVNNEDTVVIIQYGVYKEGNGDFGIPSFEDLHIRGADVEVKDGYWLVRFNADKNMSNNTFSFFQQNTVIREVTVKNYKSIYKNSMEEDLYKGNTESRVVNFIRDTKAPKIDNKAIVNEKMYDFENGMIKIPFYDEPFNGSIQKGPTGLIAISSITIEGITKEVILDVSDDRVKISNNNSIVIDLKQTNLTDYRGYLLEGSDYIVNFQAGSIRDGNDYLGKQFNINSIGNNIAPITVPKQVGIDLEGEVPQTTKAFIQSGRDLQLGINGQVSNIDYNPYKIGTIAWMRNNPRAIVVRFHGNPLPESALNKSNYIINGSPLSETSLINYYEEDIDTRTSGKERFTVIYLGENTINATGTYSIQVRGITNNKGKRMMPINDAISLVDNTGATLKSYKLIGSRDIELVFDEAIEFFNNSAEYRAMAVSNFEVMVNGSKFSVEDVYISANTIRLHLAEIVNDFNSFISVRVVEDYDGNIYITDKEKNYLINTK
ncbi:hypothetical protein J2Z44_000955 [Clostridium punense]|uniref:SbsA Ig-like domain-containing protein n=1 Tax=Clostridium punense TaxID=1054297 RepID=A0ABS4K069_9CLOT|nr:MULTISPECIES: hypothetical protein [Clostridium]EQB88388.1 hypothetical protein M918_04400 [Clostridium sp. BL8]MBP2021168.1 hypothetical protein [Clostridium punense]